MFLDKLDLGTYIIINFSIIICALSYYIYAKLKQIGKLEQSVTKLNSQLSELDEQAKLIIKTDLELNRTQEELDRKITNLLALQRFSRNIRNLLERESIFINIDEELIEDLGFSSCIVITYEDSNIETKVAINIKEKQEFPLSLFKQITVLLEEKNIIVGSLSSLQLIDFSKDLIETVSLSSFLIAPIKTNDITTGIIILGNLEGDIAEGSKEIAEIMSTQINQTIENIILFEKIYSSQRTLENHVKERTQDLSRALQEVEKVSKLKNDFISAVSHELRTPLTSIKGYASLLASEKFGKLPDEAKTRLERINIQSNTLVDMINSLLDIARIESGKAELNITNNNLVESIKSTVELLHPQVKEKNINLVTNLPEILITKFDKNLIERAIINLISNAIKFTPESKTIEISLEEIEDSVKISVKDQGMGMSEEDCENIFKEFYRTKEATRQAIKGTGLGLSLVRNIVKVHKGKIQVESQINQGSTFIITLPKENDQRQDTNS